ncbi:MAG: HEAT repeat domain-containing protein [Planctomycetaceae bacterium]|jgi:hypothetical protein|nr:HEAT repeat domain-containing protein [Planctomycetaceae bacterium]
MKKLIIFLLLSATSFADTLSLRDGSTLTGKLLNPDELPRVSYNFQTSGGITVSLPPKVVENTRKDERAELTQYALTAPFVEDTAAAQLELAQWCREQRLMEQMRVHASRVVEHEPDNKTARLMLQQEKIDGVWTTRKDYTEGLGYVRDGGAWKTPQEVEIENRKENVKKRRIEWKKGLTKLRANLAGNRELQDELTSINDPVAIPIIAEMLKDERNPDVRTLYIRALSNIGTAGAVMVIAGWALEEGLVDVRKNCFDEIRKHPVSIPVVSHYYAQFLVARPGKLSPLECQANNARINIAAYAIGEIGGTTVIPELIDALVTTHNWKTQMSSTGSANNSTGKFSWGDATIDGSQNVENKGVRNALIKLTRQDFNFDKQAWRNWLMNSRKTPTFDARRG